MTLDELGAYMDGYHKGQAHALGWFTHPWHMRRWFTSRAFWRMVRQGREDLGDMQRRQRRFECARREGRIRDESGSRR